MNLTQGTSAVMNIECPCGHSFSVEVEEKPVIVKGLATTRRVRRSWLCPECQMPNLPPPEAAPVEPTPPSPVIVVATTGQMAKFMLTQLGEQLHEEGPPSDVDPLPHPNCKAHRRLEGEECSCDAWWEAEKAECERIEEMACESCGDVSCDGGEACPENSLEHVRASRDAARDATRRLRAERHEARKLLMEALALPVEGARRGKPLLADLACGALAVIGALRLQSLVLAAEMGLPEGCPSEGWEVRGNEWVKDGPKGSKIVVRCHGMKDWTWSFEMLALVDGEPLSGEHATARGCMIAADAALARLGERVQEN